LTSVIFVSVFGFILAAFATILLREEVSNEDPDKSVSKIPGHKWQVRLNKDAFTFRTEAEARAFAETLQARIQAPHRFPISQQRSAAG
jgi:hypothetical protein